MQERAINISSINRQQIGKSRPEDFTIKFDPQMHLDTEMNHELAVDRVVNDIFVGITSMLNTVTKRLNIQKIMVLLGRPSLSSTVCIHMMI